MADLSKDPSNIPAWSRDRFAAMAQPAAAAVDEVKRQIAALRERGYEPFEVQLPNDIFPGSTTFDGLPIKRGPAPRALGSRPASISASHIQWGSSDAEPILADIREQMADIRKHFREPVRIVVPTSLGVQADKIYGLPVEQNAAATAIKVWAKDELPKADELHVTHDAAEWLEDFHARTPESQLALATAVLDAFERSSRCFQKDHDNLERDYAELNEEVGRLRMGGPVGHPDSECGDPAGCPQHMEQWYSYQCMTLSEENTKLQAQVANLQEIVAMQVAALEGRTTQDLSAQAKAG